MQLPLISCLVFRRTRDDSLYIPAFVFCISDMDLAKTLGASWRTGSLRGGVTTRSRPNSGPGAGYGFKAALVGAAHLEAYSQLN